MSDGAPAAVPDGEVDGYRDRFLPVSSWALYDFANTLFSAMVVTLAMPKVLGEATGRQMPMALASAAALLLSAFAGPFLGALADVTGSTKLQVVVWSLVCCACSAALAFVPEGNPFLLAAIFTLAYAAYNVAISLYDAFLPEVASPGRMGFVSGIGVGVGYLGALLGFPVAGWMKDRFAYEWIFAAAGGLMLLFSVPFVLFVRERRTVRTERFTLRLGMEEFRQAHRTIRSLPKRPALLLFLLGNLLAVDSLNAMIQWVGQFFRKAWNAEENTVIALLTGLSLSAFLLGVVAGKASDRLGAGRVLFAAVASLAAVALVDMAVPNRDIALWTTILAGGLGASGIWLASRRILVDLVPVERLGEYMGILGITRKASIFGTITLASLADAFSDALGDSLGWRLAVGFLALPLAGAFLCLEGSRRAALRERSAAPSSTG